MSIADPSVNCSGESQGELQMAWGYRIPSHHHILSLPIQNEEESDSP